MYNDLDVIWYRWKFQTENVFKMVLYNEYKIYLNSIILLFFFRSPLVFLCHQTHVHVQLDTYVAVYKRQWYRNGRTKGSSELGWCQVLYFYDFCVPHCLTLGSLVWSVNNLHRRRQEVWLWWLSACKIWQIWSSLVERWD